MAATKQELSLELTVRSEGFKAKLLEAQADLLRLQQKSLGAGKASEKLAKDITKAKIAVKMARNEYNLATNALKQHSIQANKTSVAVTKLGKNQKRSNMAMTQAAYAIDDMQYGFQGVQNNIQAMAVSMGASGPLVIGLTLVTVAVGVLYKRFQKAQKEAKALQDALNEKQGLMATMLRHAEVVDTADKNTKAYKDSLKALKDKGYDPLTMSTAKYIDMLKKQMLVEAKLEANKTVLQDALRERMELEEDAVKAQKKNENMIRNVGADSPYVKGLLGTANAAEKAQKELDEVDAKISKLVNVGADLQKLLSTTKVTDDNKGDDKNKPGDEGVKDGKLYTHGFLKGMSGTQMADAWYKQLNSTIKDSLELQKAQGAGKVDLLKSELAQLEAADMNLYSLEAQNEMLHRMKVLKAEIANQPLLADNGVGLTPDEALFEKFKKDLATIRQLFDEGTISFDEWMSRVETLSESFAKVDAATQASAENSKLFAQAFIGAFESAATQGGNFLETLAKGLMSSLGTILIQQGTAAIFSGIAKNAVVPGSGSDAIGKGAIVVGAGIALKAGSSIMGRAGGAGGASGGGGGGGSRSSSPTSTVRPNPVRENARNRGSNLIIPMDRMRFGMQGAEDNYSGFN
jgi:hypothetical protein